MQFGVSYFGVRNPQHFQRDLEEIARLGFTSIIFTFSEEDHRFYQGSLAGIVHTTVDGRILYRSLGCLWRLWR